jgi:hypothetical protein
MAVIFVDMRGPEARIRAARGDREMVRDLRDRMLAHLDAEEVEARSPFWTAWEWLWWEAR